MTGASSGIGEAYARLLASAGVATVVVARREDRLRALAAAHPAIEVLAADLADEDGLARVEARLRDPSRPIDLLVNNAGFGIGGRFADLDLARVDALLAVNVRALVHLTHAALPGMRLRRRGWILNVSSVAGFVPSPSSAVYGPSKAFVTRFSEALHEEVAEDGVVVHAQCPGFTLSEFHEVSGAAGLGARRPGVVWKTSEDVAAHGLRAVADGGAVSVPGALYKAVRATTLVVPPSLVRRLAGRVGRRRAPADG